MSATAIDYVRRRPVEQLTTFLIDGHLFGIDVLKIEEVTGKQKVYEVPRSPSFIRGLVNLRGQIVTALGLRELFQKDSSRREDQMSVVCKLDGNLVALVVDSIGDVVEIERSLFESPPDTIPAEVRRFIKGIYKMNGQLMSVIDLAAIEKEFSPNTDPATTRIN
ncbi:MAG: chemotaxis protein CheW [Deltaproteobacteria bacterium]|nr:chemotaxis protein CheW [Deltaproteobacteria bacterium]